MRIPSRLPSLRSSFETSILNLLLGRERASYLPLLTDNRGFISTQYKFIETHWQICNCVFTLSTGRCGTMMLAQLLGLAGAILAMHEPLPPLIFPSLEAYTMGGDIEHWASLIHAARDSFIAMANHADRVYVETNNRLTFLAAPLAFAYPQSRFIHLHRHPYEVIRSGMKRNWYRGNMMDPARITPKADDPYYGRWNALSIIEKNAWLWWRINEDSANFIQQLPRERQLTFPSDAMFSCDLNQIKKLFKFVGAPAPSESRIRRMLNTPVNAEKKGSYPEIADWTLDERQAVDRIVAPVAHRLGYSGFQPVD